MVAMINKMVAHNSETGIVAPPKETLPQMLIGKTINTKKNGMMIKRMTVSLLGKFNFNFPLSIIGCWQQLHYPHCS